MGSEPSKSVGQAIRRREDLYLLRGEGQYLDDLSEPARTLYLGLVLSPHVHAKILSIDTSEAASLPGVFAVLTGDDLATLVEPIHPHTEAPGYEAADREVVARRLVRFVGETVAIVLAENRYVAQDATELVRVTYEALPVSANLETATAPGAPLVHAHVANNILYESEFATANFEAVHGNGQLKLRERFRHGRVSAVPIEPRGCLAIPEHGDSIVLYTSTQIPHLVRAALAGHIDRPESSIRVVVPEVGGGFGMKAQVYPEEFIAAALCFKYRRPIKWVQDRREELSANTHARDHIYDVEIAFTPAGIVTSLKLELDANAGAYSVYPWGGGMEATGGARMLVGPYRITDYAYKARAVLTHSAPAGVYRGVAQPACVMVMEGLIDRIARQLGIDPAEVRRRNTIAADELPWVNVLGVTYDTGSYHECLELALTNSGYEDFRKTQPADRLVDGKYRGVGIGNMVEPTGFSSLAYRARGLTKLSGLDSATVRISPTGKATVYVSHASAGQGHLTTFAQIAADHLGAKFDDVRVVEGDTAASPHGTGTFASRSAITGGGAIIQAAGKVAHKIRRLAASLLEASPVDIVLEDGKAAIVGVPGKHVTYQAIAEMAYSMGLVALPDGETFGLEASEYFDPPTLCNANAVHVAYVSVDAMDGRVSIDKYCIVHDCGRIINPMIVDGQIHGGAAQGIGEALMEEVVYDAGGQLQTASLQDYLLPTSLDIPSFSVFHRETPSDESLGGFKGVGEGGVIGAVPAVTNAVADALSGIGANVNSVPLRPSYLLSLLQAER